MNWIQGRSDLFGRFPPDERYLIGVSGGRDSVTLLHLLAGLGYKKLVVCHLNHRLRGRSSAADARFVGKFAAFYELDLELKSADIPALAKKRKMSIEAAARQARYSFFASVAGRRRCRTIFLGHHADDLVETFLINLIRGAGTTGLAAMREISTRRIGEVELTIVRPLLGIWRAEIDKYVREHSLEFREDASNKSWGPLRNRLRGKIIPYLEKELDRNVRRNIWRAAMILAEEENWIDNQLSELEKIALPVATLQKLPLALQRRQILKWLRAHNISNVGFDVVESIRALLDHKSHVAKINLPQDRHVRRRAKKIFVTD